MQLDRLQYDGLYLVSLYVKAKGISSNRFLVQECVPFILILCFHKFQFHAIKPMANYWHENSSHGIHFNDLIICFNYLLIFKISCNGKTIISKQ